MISVFRGDTLNITFTFKDNIGAPMDLTGCTLFCTIKSSIEDADSDAKLSKLLSITLPTTAGIAILSATTDEMRYLRGQYIMDIQLKLADGSIQTPFKTDFYVDEDVTIRTS